MKQKITWDEETVVEEDLLVASVKVKSLPSTLNSTVDYRPTVGIQHHFVFDSSFFVLSGFSYRQMKMRSYGRAPLSASLGDLLTIDNLGVDLHVKTQSRCEQIAFECAGGWMYSFSEKFLFKVAAGFWYPFLSKKDHRAKVLLESPIEDELGVNIEDLVRGQLNYEEKKQKKS